MNKLSKPAENLLKEIIENRNDKKQCDLMYWEHKFELASPQEDEFLRDCFKELKDNDLIETIWADNIPYYLRVKIRGETYFDDLKQYRAESINYSNNFFAPINNVQVQQNSINSSQSLNVNETSFKDEVNNFVSQIREYSNLLEKELGTEQIQRLNENIEKLQESSDHGDKNKSHEILGIVKEIFINAAGGVLSTGFIQMIQNMMG